MKVVILDDLDEKPLTHGQEVAAKIWMKKLERHFPHGELQIFLLPESKVESLHALLAETP